MKEPKTNIDFINDFICVGHPLHQVFVVEAITQYANEFAEYTDEQCEKYNQEMSNPFINMFDWREISKAFLKKKTEFYT